jgi:hypothetical protein
MTKQSYEPGPGLSTSKAAFNDLTREIAQRNERAHKEARKIRIAKHQQQILRLRQRDL